MKRTDHDDVASASSCCRLSVMITWWSLCAVFCLPSLSDGWMYQTIRSPCCCDRTKNKYRRSVVSGHHQAETPVIDNAIRTDFVTTFTTFDDDIDIIFAKYGMPWRSSIQYPSNNNDDKHDENNQHGSTSLSTSTTVDVFYMPFFEWQLHFMKENLTNLKVVPTRNRHRTEDLTYVESPSRRKRMITLCFESDEYRLIRMTLLDGSAAVQVFTSLWYPRIPYSGNSSNNDINEYKGINNRERYINFPVLGIDLLQFNRQQRHLTVVDFQPIPSVGDADSTNAEQNIQIDTIVNSDTHNRKTGSSCSEYSSLFEDRLKPIRDSYPSLQHRMSDRFYNENDGFFSSQMLLGKGSNSPDYVWTELWPAYQDYVRQHVEMVKDECRKNYSTHCSRSNHHDNDNNHYLLSNTNFRHVLDGHRRYDDYSSVRDPAHGLIASAFGKDYADAFVYDVLFPLSDGKPDISRTVKNTTFDGDTKTTTVQSTAALCKHR